MERLTVNDLNKVCYDPWELCGMDRYCKKGCHEEGGCTKGCHILKMYQKLAEYEDLEEQGKLLKLPVAVGDFVYKIKYGEIESHKVVKIELEESGIYFKSGLAQGEWPFCTLDNFGKSVFLTREEAEAALKELEGENETD